MAVQGRQRMTGARITEDQRLRPIQLELEISCRDADGSCQERRILVQYFELIDGGSQALLSGHCASRGPFTDLRTAQIERCVDPASSAVVDDVVALLQARYARSLQGRLESLEAELAAPLAVLLALANGDQLLQRGEKNLIAAYLHRHQPAGEGIEPLHADEIARHLRWIQPAGAEALGAAVEALAAAPEFVRTELLELCLAVADVREAREGEEQPLIDRLQQRWFSHS
jgi:hypothetical protein